MMNCGSVATIVEYYGWDNITVQFDDKTIVEKRRYSEFKNGSIHNPNAPHHNFKDRNGERRQINGGEYATIIQYISDRNVTVQFDNGYIMHNCLYQNFKRGKVKSPLCKSMYGIGYIGIGEYQTLIDGKETKAYKAWRNMMSRCYCEAAIKHRHTYEDCIVSEEFHCFQDFAKWYYSNMWGSDIKYQVDKDILVKGNKIYSPETCVLVDNKLNNILSKSNINNGEYPIGVTFAKRLNAYTPQLKIDGKSQYLGIYDNPIDAFYKYKEAKEQYIKRVADEYKQKYTDFPDKLYHALYAYEIDIND